jgi:hypothetical protein
MKRPPVEQELVALMGLSVNTNEARCCIHALAVRSARVAILRSGQPEYSMYCHHEQLVHEYA